MEIIKHGNTMINAKCLCCGCEFRFSKNEEKHTYISNPFDYQMFDSYYYINCPECGAEIRP